MAEATHPPSPFDGPVDYEQAAELASSLVAPELLDRSRALSQELDEIHRRLRSIDRQVMATLDELLDREHQGILLRGRDIVCGIDSSMTYPTFDKARELFRVWGGHDGLLDRIYRLVNVTGAWMGEAPIVEPEDIEERLAAERG